MATTTTPRRNGGISGGGKAKASSGKSRSSSATSRSSNANSRSSSATGRSSDAKTRSNGTHGNGHGRQLSQARSKTANGSGHGRELSQSRSKTAKSTGQSASSKAAKTAAKATKTGKAVKAVSQAPTPSKMVRKLALKALKKAAGAVVNAGGEAIRNAADKAAATGSGGVGKMMETVSDNPMEKLAHKRLPIQRSVDVAVPIQIAWEEFLAFELLPEGAHCVTDVERVGDELFGRTTGPASSEWAAEILDERPAQSFAWQSHEGSDIAGLVTFHRLSERLTRLELNLDVVPTSLYEAAQLASRLADRKAQAELRRFKARLELINPDLYEDDLRDEDGEDSDAEGAEGDRGAGHDGEESAGVDNADQ